jgi:hypothetical protein
MKRKDFVIVIVVAMGAVVVALWMLSSRGKLQSAQIAAPLKLEKHGSVNTLREELTGGSPERISNSARELLDATIQGIPRNLWDVTTYEVTGETPGQESWRVRVRLKQIVRLERGIGEPGQDGWYDVSTVGKSHFMQVRIGQRDGNKTKPVSDLNALKDNEILLLVLIDVDGNPMSVEVKTGSDVQRQDMRLGDLMGFGPRLPRDQQTLTIDRSPSTETGDVLVEIQSKEVEFTFSRGSPWVLDVVRLVVTEP